MQVQPSKVEPETDNEVLVDGKTVTFGFKTIELEQKKFVPVISVFRFFYDRDLILSFSGVGLLVI